MKYIAEIEIPDEYLEEDDDGLVYKELTLNWEVCGSKEDYKEQFYNGEDTPLMPLIEFKAENIPNQFLLDYLKKVHKELKDYTGKDKREREVQMDMICELLNAWQFEVYKNE
ncbi:MAG: hypothetical protein Q4A12_08305 [Eubacteriales bacterium]|nr:hypothetical protein [Eubacteriales bacterium]